MTRRLLTFLLAAGLLCGAAPLRAQVTCVGGGCAGGGTVTSPVATDPISFTGAATFDNVANTPLVCSDGITSPSMASAAGANLALSATAPAATTGASQAGKAVSVTASAAVASTDTAGAAAGGSVTITAGNAARFTSGNANGGDVVLATGAGIGTGTAGQVKVPSGTAAKPAVALAGTGNYIHGLYYNTDFTTPGIAYAGAPAASFSVTRLNIRSDAQLGFTTTTSLNTNPDTGVGRSAAGIVKITDGSTGYGSLTLGGTLNFQTSGSVVQAASSDVFSIYGPSTNAISLGTNQVIFGTALNSADVGISRSSGNVLMVNNSAGSIGGLLARRSVETVAATKGPAITESDELYTNGADVDGQAITLPNDPTAGVCYEFALTSTDSSGSFTIAPSAGETLQDAATTCATSFSATAKGATARICAVSGGSGAQWYVMSKNGTWTCTP